MKQAAQSEIVDFLSFLNTSPTAWHAVANCASSLEKNGFTELKEKDGWEIKAGGNYFVRRSGSSLAAFVVPKKKPDSMHIIASHTDSPSLKIKPNAEFVKENMRMLGLEVYGAPLLTSWLNRDLGIAGKVVTLNKDGDIEETLVDLEKTPVIIPQLAIHLDRGVNDKGLIVNKQEHLAAIAGTDGKKTHQTSFLERAISKEIAFKELICFDLFLYPIEKARLIGEDHTLISSYRIDNLQSVQASLSALLQSNKPSDHLVKMIVLFDHEEIGSSTGQGADSPFLLHLIERISLSLNLSREEMFRLISRSLSASVDLAHAVHPSFNNKHEPNHPVLLNHGITIKTNAQGRYASDSITQARMIALCKKYSIAYQYYVARGDIPCGSTIGQFIASQTGIPTVDIGAPQLSMHSCRELMGANDHLSMIELLKAFLKNE